jgi:hypothetical protein
MQTPRAEIARERRRQLQVRRAFEAGLQPSTAWGGRDPGEFLLACADYLLFSMDRLHDQDQAIHDLLLERVAPSDAATHERLRVLGERQLASRALLHSFRGTAARLRNSRDSSGRAVEAFTAEARLFTGEFGALLQARRNPLRAHTDVLFGDADWLRVAGVTTASVAREHQLFDRVRDTAPAGADPEEFTPEYAQG